MRTTRLNVSIPWTLSHYLPWGGLNPLYRALFDHAPDTIAFSAWHNVKLYRRLASDPLARYAMRAAFRTQRRKDGESASDPVARQYEERWTGGNRFLTRQLIGDIEFHHTVPFPSFTRPFVFHCEMFAPLVRLLSAAEPARLDIEGIRRHYRELFKSPECLLIASHVPETLTSISRFLSDPTIDGKLIRSWIGLSRRGVDGPRDLSSAGSLARPVFLFAAEAGDRLGDSPSAGHVALRFWKQFVESGRDGLLIMRWDRPTDKELQERGVDLSFVRSETGRSLVWYRSSLNHHDMNALMGRAQFFLSLGAGLQSCSIMQAMHHGAVPVVTDTIGTSLYVRDDETGVVLRGVREAAWYQDEVTGALVERPDEDSSLEDVLVRQLTDRILNLLENPCRYHDLRIRARAFVEQGLSGDAFSQDFWEAVETRVEWRTSTPARIAVSRPVGFLLRSCTVLPDEWAPMFETSVQPLLRINSRSGRVYESGGAMIYSLKPPGADPSDWSIVRQYDGRHTDGLVFADSLDELDGVYLPDEAKPREEPGRFLIHCVSEALRPFPVLRGACARVWHAIRPLVRRPVLSSTPRMPVAVESVRRGVSGYNIVRCRGLYYALLEREGEFSPETLEKGGYSSCFSDDSLDVVLQCIAGSIPASSAEVLAQGDADVICETFHGFTILRRGDRFVALPEAGTGSPSSLLDGPSIVYSGASLEELRRAVESHLSGAPYSAESLFSR